MRTLLLDGSLSRVPETVGAAAGAAVGTRRAAWGFLAVECEAVMVLWGSVVALLASLAGLVTLGSTYVLGDASALVFAMSLFTLICAMEARS